MLGYVAWEVNASKAFAFRRIYCWLEAPHSGWREDRTRASVTDQGNRIAMTFKTIDLLGSWRLGSTIDQSQAKGIGHHLDRQFCLQNIR
ncbi:hypothetical protein ACVDG5_013665 [Mesorhizobium sp. ORM6]